MKITSIFSVLLLSMFGFLSNGQDGHMKVITYNIWNGFDFGKDENRRALVTEWIKNQNPEIVGLQELCNYSQQKLHDDAMKWGHNYSVLLKEQGYSVGLTSKFPIELMEKIFEGMHHGAMHCKTNGIDIFIVHFSPSSYKKRQEEAEIILGKLKEIAGKNHKILVLGDFNSHSPFDADYYKNGVLLGKYLSSENNKNDKGNLASDKLDYSVMSSFLAYPMIDVCQHFTTGIDQRGSFPSLILNQDSKKSEKEFADELERIDYILVSPNLAEKCVMSKVFNGTGNGMLSDHYPVMAVFEGVDD